MSWVLAIVLVTFLLTLAKHLTNAIQGQKGSFWDKVPGCSPAEWERMVAGARGICLQCILQQATGRDDCSNAG